jgi:serine/threonine-protein kinase
MDTLATDNKQAMSVVSENRSAAKRVTKEQRRKQVSDSIAATKAAPTQTTAPGSEEVQKDDVPKEGTTATNDEAVENTEVKDTTDNDSRQVRYKVRNKAYFHDSPDESSQRDAFIVHWNNAVLKPLNEKNGFVYVVFTNHLGQTSKGWLSKDDLIAIR